MWDGGSLTLVAMGSTTEMTRRWDSVTMTRSLAVSCCGVHQQPAAPAASVTASTAQQQHRHHLVWHCSKNITEGTLINSTWRSPSSSLRWAMLRDRGREGREESAGQTASLGVCERSPRSFALASAKAGRALDPGLGWHLLGEPRHPYLSLRPHSLPLNQFCSPLPPSPPSVTDDESGAHRGGPSRWLLGVTSWGQLGGGAGPHRPACRVRPLLRRRSC